MTRHRIRRALVPLALVGAVVLAGLLAAPPAPAQGGQGAQSGQGAQEERSILVVEVDGPLDPVTVDLVEEALEEAERERAALLVIAVDSPGALDVDLRDLASGLLESEVPVAGWIQGGGAAERAAATLLLSSDVVAASTDGSVGLAGESLDGRTAFPTPVPPAIERLLESPRWTAVADERLGAERAREAGAVEVVAPTLRDLIAELDGREVGVGGETVALDLGDVVERDGEARKEVLPIRFRELSLGGQLQHALTSPFAAYLLLVTGLGLVVFEFFAIGVGLAGVAGSLLVVAAFVGLEHLPVDAWSLALVASSFLALSVDVQAGAPRFWAAVGGVLLLVGSLRLYGGAAELDPPLWQVLLVVAGVLLFVLPGLAAVIRSRFSTPTIGRESMIGEQGTARATFDPDGIVEVRGALWKARSTRAASLRPGDPVEVTAVRGLALEVLPADGSAGDDAREGAGDPGEESRPPS